jgi:hypothetical protein
VRELMSKPEVKVIDFITDLQFSHKWASEIVPVNWIIISRNDLGQLYYLIMVILQLNIRNPHKFLVKTIADLASLLKTKISGGDI